MERAAWTDERLDDLAEAMRTGFARVDQDIRDLRGEMREGFDSLSDRLGGEINELRRTMIGFGGGIIIALIGVIAAILARGV
jgi:3-dehydroquinate synthetase